MSFSSRLKDYMDAIGCSASELASVSGVSKSTISRYLSGQRTPSPASGNPARLAAALARLGQERGLKDYDERAIESVLVESANLTEGYALFAERLRDVFDTFGVTHNRLARSMDFDPSYISRILAGQRRPADAPKFVDGIAAYIARNYYDAEGVAAAASLTGEPPESLDSPAMLGDAIKRYLGSSNPAEPARQIAANSFLESLDKFDLNDFLNDIKFDELKIPTVPFQFPTTKTYSGISEMKQAELDFLRAAVTSRAMDDVILFSDMPLEEMAEDEEFAKKVMYGMALLIRKGVRLHNIHDVHRPVNELFMGLEGWVPVYLTGQISSYYLPVRTNDVFHHFIRSAGSVAVTGEAIEGNQGGGRYVVTKNSGDVAYLRRRAQELLNHAKPLLRVFREGDTADLESILQRLAKKAEVEPVIIGEGTFKNMKLTVWPSSHALVEKENDPKVSFLIEHPALVDAMEHYEPTLFETSSE